MLTSCEFSLEEIKHSFDFLSSQTSTEEKDKPTETPERGDHPPLSLQSFSRIENKTLHSRGLQTDVLFLPELNEEKERYDRLECSLVIMQRDIALLSGKTNLPAMVQRCADYYPIDPDLVQAPEPEEEPIIEEEEPLEPSPPAKPRPIVIRDRANLANIPHNSALSPLPDGKSFKVPPNLVQYDARKRATMPNTPIALNPMMPSERVQTLQAERQANYQNAVMLQKEQYATLTPPMPLTSSQPMQREKAPVAEVKTYTQANAFVSNVRVGKHPDKIRLVLDISNQTDWSAYLDNNKGELRIELPTAAWEAPARTETFGTLPVLGSYKIEDMSNGVGKIFVAQLKTNTQILNQAAYPALSGSGERLVIDLAQ